jgi:hypothetical protein
MADFRKLFYALAIVALLAGLTVPASAQAPFQCQTNTGAPPLLRGEGYTELTGDVILSCTGGIPTVANQPVPQANFTIFLNTNVTSRLLAAGVWTEALLIVDEPHSPTNPTRPLTNCGFTGAPDNGPSGAGVCEIISTGNPAMTYDGTTNTFGNFTCAGVPTPPATTPPVAGSYSCGRPNVYQARTGSAISATQQNALTWAGVPIDPPGSTTTRTFRFTNIRANATSLIGSILPSSTFTTTYVQAQISVSGNTTMSINNPQQIVGYVLRGLTTSAIGGGPFLQCSGQNTPILLTVPGTSSTTVLSSTPLTGAAPPTNTFQTGNIRTPVFTFTEGFQTSWKPKNTAFNDGQAGSNGSLVTGYNTPNTTNYPNDVNQNVPGAIYYTEAGFQNNTTDPNPNPPVGTSSSTVNISGLGNLFSDASTGIVGAGVASQGTRLAVQVNTSTIPTGTTTNPFVVLVPEVIPITLANGTITGVAVLTSTDANGNTAYTPPSPVPAVPGSVFATQTFMVLPSSGLVVYEVLFADPFAVESASVPIVVAYNPSLASNAPTPGLTTTAVGSFAPFYSTAAAALPSSTLPVPRFTSLLSSSNLFTLVKCACDMLFPYVSAGGGYDTGIAIANTSLDPGAAGGFVPGAVPQSGTVEFWYYGNGTNPPAQCTNTTTPGTCPGTTTVGPGQVLTYVLSTGSATWGLDNRAAAFTGYIIAQAQFQYCHAFAFIGALGGGPTSPGISEGYLALILDSPGLLRSVSIAEELNN